MLSAKFDRKIEVQKKIKTLNEVGTPIYSGFQTVKSLWANIDYRGGSMVSGVFTERAKTDATFTIRYNPIVDYDCRIKYQNSVYAIDHIEIVGRSEGMRLRCVMFDSSGGSADDLNNND